ncbi:hypothetical protein BDQ17DRAFT_1205773, partial [Cyathus striatus]
QIYAPNLQHNTSSLTNIKFTSAALAGAAAGILGLQNVPGFALFVVACIWTGICIQLKINSDLRGKNGSGGGGKVLENWWDVLLPGQDAGFAFVLVWTLFYGM